MGAKRLVKLSLATSTLIGLTFFGVSVASAEQAALNNLNGQYGVNLTSCSLCHTSAPALNVFGLDFIAANGTKNSGYNPNWATLDAGDADGDGVTNGAEIQAGTDPHLAPGQTATTETASVTGCMTGSVATPLMLLLAMLSLGLVSGRKEEK